MMRIASLVWTIFLGLGMGMGVVRGQSGGTVALPASPDRIVLKPGECASTVTGEHRLRWFCAGVGEDAPGSSALELRAQLEGLQKDQSALVAKIVGLEQQLTDIRSNLVDARDNNRSLHEQLVEALAKNEALQSQLETVRREKQKDIDLLEQEVASLSERLETTASIAKTVNVQDADGDGVADARDLCSGTPLGQPVDSTGCVKNQELILEGVQFAWNSVELTAESRQLLDDIAARLKAHPDFKFEIAGHTDNSGSAVYNQHISSQRANAVRDYLLQRGALQSQLAARGYGEDRPIASNATSEGRSLNRRVTMTRLP